MTHSEPGHWEELFWPGLDAIEFGFLADEAEVDKVLERVADHGLSWGLHSPLLRGGLSNELCSADGILFHGLQQLRREAALARERGARYMLVHFPWFGSNALPLQVARDWIKRGLADLQALHRETKLPLVLEPKLGPARAPGGIAYLHQIGPALLMNYRDLPLCLDVGDWSIAAEALGSSGLELMAPWLPYTGTLHLHNVWLHPESLVYRWRPFHPADDHVPGYYPLNDFIELAFRRRPDLHVVLEADSHHLDVQRAQEGLAWLRRLAGRS